MRKKDLCIVAWNAAAICRRFPAPLVFCLERHKYGLAALWLRGEFPRLHFLYLGDGSRTQPHLLISLCRAGVLLRRRGPHPAPSEITGTLESSPGAFRLLGWRIRRRAFEGRDEVPELWVGAEILQIVVRHHAIGIFVTTIDGFLQVLEGVIGAVGRDCYTGKGVPHREWVSLSLRIVLFFDHVAKQLAGLSVAMGVGQCDPELLQCHQQIGMLRSQAV